MKELWPYLSLRRHRQLYLLFFLMVASTFAEMFSIGIVIPFLTVLTDPGMVFNMSALKPVLNFFNFSSKDELFLPMTIIFCIAILLAGALRLFLIWVSTRLSFAIGADLSIDVYRKSLYQPYSTHISRNSSEIINSIATKTNTVIHNIILPVLTILSAIILFAMVLVMLMLIEPMVTLGAIVGFGGIYVFIIWVTRKNLSTNGEIIAHESTQVIKALQEGLGGIREVLIDGLQEEYCRVYRDSDIPLRRAQGTNVFISQSPRYLMEALGMVLIAVFAYLALGNQGGLAEVLPVLGAMALAAQRLLPVMQQAFGSWSRIQSGKATLLDILELLDQPLPQRLANERPVPLNFNQAIRLENISFTYEGTSSPVLKNISFDIKKGSRIGFVGTTGSGKSTLLDIIMGMLRPTSGKLYVDGLELNENNVKSWFEHIAHVPQNIFLSDRSIMENIALGVPKEQIDEKLLKRASDMAQISDYIETLPAKYETNVGERGVRLSGGQRQRIGIARALYKRSEVIIFDEATSALDTQTEREVMNVINELGEDLTILMIAHRITTLKDCSAIIELKNGKINKIGKYEDFTI